jgi:hypothetical protein
LAVRDGRIILDGREVVLEGTTDWRQDILAFFRALTAAPRGSWVSGNDISRDVRWKRKLDRAPYSLRMLVEPKDGTDHRLRAAAWRE